MKGGCRGGKAPRFWFIITTRAPVAPPEHNLQLRFCCQCCVLDISQAELTD